ncbi:MAG: hypothetical protein JSR67_07285 [Proteobacteria bacterium]|nr:hypothetical protein [Pseudomonadota bacterium]
MPRSNQSPATRRQRPRAGLCAGGGMLCLLLAGVLGGAVAAAAEPPAADVAEAPESTVRVTVEPVRGLSDYAAVTRLLQGAAGVRRVNIVAARGNTARFEIVGRGDEAQLAQALGAVAGLSATAGAAHSYHYQPSQPQG